MRHGAGSDLGQRLRGLAGTEEVQPAQQVTERALMCGLPVQGPCGSWKTVLGPGLVAGSLGRTMQAQFGAAQPGRGTWAHPVAWAQGALGDSPGSPKPAQDCIPSEAPAEGRKELCGKEAALFRPLTLFLLDADHGVKGGPGQLPKEAGMWLSLAGDKAGAQSGAPKSLILGPEPSESPGADPAPRLQGPLPHPRHLFCH